MIDTSDIRKNLKLLIDGDPWVVVDFQFVKPGKGQAFTRTRLKNMITGSVVERNYRSGEKLEEAHIDEREMVFLYSQGDTYTFMDNTTYDQVEIPSEQLGDAVHFLTENMNVEVLFFNGRPIGISLPNFVNLEIVDTEPATKGDTVSGATKPAKLSTGYTLNVPLFVNTGDWIVVDTRTGEYVERVKK
ncbi:MAG: elongation factor P [Desulfobacterota bacterium]|nr:elongation factor P [Thermodesulfobacteriota bacterium]